MQKRGFSDSSALNEFERSTPIPVALHTVKYSTEITGWSPCGQENSSGRLGDDVTLLTLQGIGRRFLGLSFICPEIRSDNMMTTGPLNNSLNNTVT